MRTDDSVIGPSQTSLSMDTSASPCESPDLDEQHTPHQLQATCDDDMSQVIRIQEPMMDACESAQAGVSDGSLMQEINHESSPSPSPSPQDQGWAPTHTPLWKRGPQHGPHVEKAESFLLGVPGGPKWEELLASFITLKGLSSSLHVSAVFSINSPPTNTLAGLV